MERDHNNPPDMIDLARETTAQISQWFAENPAVSSEEEARAVKLHIDRAKLCLKDLEDARDKKVRPLNEQVAAINAEHRAARRPLGVVLDAMLDALNVFIQREEEKRIAEAMEAKRKAQEAEERAREADRLEREKIENAKVGEVGIDLAAVSAQADEAFHEYEKAERAAIRAQQAAHVKVGGGFSRAIGLREKETLHVEDPKAALQDMGLAENVRLAILTAARAFRKLHGRLPSGISATIDRSVG